MIIGIGTDICSIDRMSRALERSPGLRQRLFTCAESSLPAESLAARFAAKEAVAKALGAPPGLAWTDVEILRGPGGAPHLTATGTVAARAAELGVQRWHVSLSHDAGIATALVIAEG